VDAAVPAAVPAAAGQYRIGVVSRQQVLKKYNKVKAEYEKLQGKVKTEQTDIDKLSDKIEGMKKDYEAQKETMTPEDRATKEAAVQKEYSQYRNMLATKQQEIDTEEQLLIRTVMAEVDQVVSKIATEQGFHLVLEGSSRSGVLYYSPTIDITQRVVDALNSKQ
jgi:outer membrane protein